MADRAPSICVLLSEPILGGKIYRQSVLGVRSIVVNTREWFTRNGARIAYIDKIAGELVILLQLIVGTLDQL